MRLPFQFSSASRRTAGALGFLIFSQWLTWPLRQAEPRRFDTIPSHPSEHACRKDDRAVAVEVLVEGDAVAGVVEKGRQRVLSILKPRPAKVFAVESTHIEGTEHGGVVAKPIPERVEYREAAFVDYDGLAVHDT